jgi:hypothetical protein
MVMVLVPLASWITLSKVSTPELPSMTSTPCASISAAKSPAIWDIAWSISGEHQPIFLRHCAPFGLHLGRAELHGFIHFALGNQSHVFHGDLPARVFEDRAAADFLGAGRMDRTGRNDERSKGNSGAEARNTGKIHWKDPLGLVLDGQP